MKKRSILFLAVMLDCTIFSVRSECNSVKEYDQTKGKINVCSSRYNCRYEYPILSTIVSCKNISFNDVLTYSEGETAYPLTLFVHDSTIPNLPSSAFQRTNKFNKIYLQNLHIGRIMPGAFNFQPNLVELYLYGNNLTTVSDGIFNSLTHLNKLNLGGNKIETITDQAFLGTNLDTLYLNNNNLSEVTSIMLNSLTKLKTFDLSFNRLTKIDKLTNFSLNDLILSNNKISMVDFEDLPVTLKKIDLANNEISEVRHYNSTKATEVLLNNNKITTFDRNDYTTVLDVSHNNVQTISRSMLGEALIKFNASHNAISLVGPDTFHNMINLEYLSLNANNISFIPNSCFKDLIKLKYLDLSDNILSTFKFGTFDGLTNLNTLNISFNKFEILPQFAFHSLSNLENFYFQNNSISDMDVRIFLSHLPKLKSVELVNNRFSCKKLLVIVHSLKNYSVSFGKGNSSEESNIYGIICFEDHDNFDKIANKSDATFEFDLVNSKLVNFFNNDFIQSAMYKYFESNFETSNFVNFLKSMNYSEKNAISNEHFDYQMKEIQLNLGKLIKQQELYQNSEEKYLKQLKDLLNKTLNLRLHEIEHTNPENLNEIKNLKLLGLHDNEQGNSLNYNYMLILILILIILIINVIVLSFIGYAVLMREKNASKINKNSVELTQLLETQ